MFEKYHLMRMELPPSSDEQSFLNDVRPVLDKIKEQPSGRDVDRLLASVDGGGPIRGDFRIGGRIETLPLFLVDERHDDELIRLQSFVVAESSADYYTRRSGYASYLLCYTYEGEGTLEYEGTTYVLREGDGFLIDCRKHQRYFTSGAGWTHLDLHFVGRPADILFQEIQSEMPVRFQLPSVDYFNKRIEKFLDACTSLSSHRHIYVHQALYSLLVEILSEGERAARRPIPEAYADLVRYMEANYMNRITLDDLSGRAALDKYYLIKEFKKYIGSTPHEYLVALRIQNACALLRSTNMTVTQICAATGFENRANFARQFRSRVGTTPSMYRGASLG